MQIKTATLYHTDWCGHCKVLKPIWHKIKQSFANDKNIMFIEYESDRNPNEVSQANIPGFPTIKLQIDNEIISYKGNRSHDDLVGFISHYKQKFNI